MAAKLGVGVAMRHPDTGAAVFLRAGSVPPEWARHRLGEHVFAHDADPGRPAPDPAPAPSLPVEPSPAASGVPAPPPRYGRGSSAAAWREWAEQVGVDLSEYGPDPSRDEVVTAAVRAGVLNGE